MMNIKQYIWPLLGGFLVGLMVYGIKPYKDLTLLSSNSWFLIGLGSFIVGLLATFLFKKKAPNKTALYLSLGVLLAIAIRLLYDVVFIDKSSHNLAVFEFVIGFVQSFPPALLGAYLGNALRNTKKA